MAEGSLGAPKRHNIDWQNPEYYNQDAIDIELERVFDICHGCRRCFNLCESFPILFDMIDDAPTGELDSVPKSEYTKVVDACTLCDMCFMTKCPYVPPHEFDLDFPHLMLRARAAAHKDGQTPLTVRQLANTDRNGKLARPVAGLANALASRKDKIGRAMLEVTTGIDRDVELPKYCSKTLTDRTTEPLAINPNGPGAGRKVALFASCIGQYNLPEIGEAALAVLAHNGIEAKVFNPGCCGMPYLEHGNIAKVADQATKIAAAFRVVIEDGYTPIASTASCGLMMKFEWPLILPENKDVSFLSAHVKDINQYLVELANGPGLAKGLTPIEGGISVHMACHSRAQNMGPKAAELLRNIPDTKVDVVERCAGHGGTFGVMKATRGFAKKTARYPLRDLKKQGNAHLCSDCPLACKHLNQERETPDHPAPPPLHPVQLLAQAYGF
ncbi:MAG: glycerol-3-phosphate dehydrogenase [Robiginitomaculum sp.]|nr:MAG: glycerol-3-phosphate dehydrogenase [Robiginitomaculum sp.]